MSENNDGGLAERGGTSNVSGTGSNFGGSGGPTGSGGSNSANVGQNMGGTVSDKSAGTSSTGGTTSKTNVVSTYGGELLPGARAPVVPGYGYAPRRDQTLQDIQEQNRIGNNNYNASNSNTGSSGSSASGNYQQPPKTITTVRQPTTTQPPTQPAVGGTRYPGIGGTTGAAAESDYDRTDWTGFGSAGPYGPGSAMGLPGGRGYAKGGNMGYQRGPGGPKKTQNYYGKGPKGGGGGGIVSANYVDAPGGAQVRPITGNRGLRHRQGVENQVRKMFGAKARPQAMQGYAGGGASNRDQSANNPPNRYLGTDRSGANSFPREENPRYVAPHGTGGGGGGMGTWEPTGQGVNPGGTPRNDYFAGGGRIKGYAGGGGMSNRDQSGFNPPNRYLGTDRSGANSFPRRENPNYTPPRGTGQGSGEGSQYTEAFAGPNGQYGIL